MASKRKRTRDGEASSSAIKKPKKAYCHFKDSWKSRDFSVRINGAMISISGRVLCGVEGGTPLNAEYVELIFLYVMVELMML